MQPQNITIIGAGAAGLFCAGLLGQAGHHVTLVDKGKKVGRKILMSGGGKCNFTHLGADANNYISHNRHFCKSALKRFTPWHFVELVNRYHIAYHEKSPGQLFCDDSAQAIVSLLEQECQKGHVHYQLQCDVLALEQSNAGFTLSTTQGSQHADKVIIASGGLSLPGLGTSPIGFKIAQQFKLPVIPIRAGLVPLTLPPTLLSQLSPLAGLSLPVHVSAQAVSFEDDLLFTHRGLSGPAILQLSNYWQVGQPITLNLLPHLDLDAFLHQQHAQHPLQSSKTGLSKLLPKRLVETLITLAMVPDKPLNQFTEKQRQALCQQLTQWTIMPNGTEGYRTAEITLGGVSTEVLSSKTMMVNQVPGLYFIGEVMDVSGWLGGYNLQWAWSSAWACANSLITEQD